MTAFMISVGMKPMGKARPRLGGRRVFMPKPYVEWKKKFATVARAQACGTEIVGKFSITIVICSKTGNMRSDIDNAAASILDALQDAKIVANDKACVDLSIRIKKHDEDIIITHISESQ